MANSDKNIVITPNIGAAADPSIVFSGADATTGPQNITLQVYPTDNGTLSFEGSAGQLFSITNSLTGTIFSVNDVSGIPSFEVNADGTVKIAEYNGRVLFGTGVDNGLDRIQVVGDVSATTFKGPLTGNATTATTLQTARAINGTNFDGSAAITTANWGTARTVTIGSTGKSVNGSANVAWTLAEIGAPSTTGTGASGTWSINVTGNAATATALQTARTIGGVSFNGTANINLPGVNAAGNQNTSGNAATATALQTTRAINGTNFNGTAAITTANWGTARTITIGGTGKSVNGSANYTWATSEIAAQTAVTLATARTINGVSFNGSANITVADATKLPLAGGSLTGTLTLTGNATSIRQNTTASWSGDAPNGVGKLEYHSNRWYVNAGADSTLVAQFRRGGSDVANINNSGVYSGSIAGNAATATALQTTRAINGTNFDGTAAITTANWGTARTINGTSINGSTNYTTANWGTARTLTIGSTGKSVNGSANVAWTLAEIGADNATNLTTGTLPDARLTGTYTNFTHRLDGSNTVFTLPNSGSTSTVARTVYGLAEYKSASSAQVGAIVIIAPNTNTTIMHQLEIQGMLYNQNIFRMTVQGYRTTGAWSDARKISFGTVDIQTRWAVDASGRNCLILGDVGTTWSYPHISVVRAMFSHTGTTDAYCTGWTVAVVTAFTGFTNISATITDSTLAGSVTGNAATATALQTTRAINGTNFNGTAAITTANWGTARTITIGGTGKSVNGSANYTWATSEIAAQTAVTLATARAINGTNFNGSAAITTANWGTARTINGTSINGSTNYTTANWGTARTLTIGSTGKSVNGSANVAWTLAEIGAQAALGFTPVQQGGGTGQGTNKIYIGWSASDLLLQIDSTNFANTWPINITKNAATATALQTARTINGVSFNGTANITVADATKLPTAGGTMTGLLIGRVSVGTDINTMNDNGSFSVRGTASTGAGISFHRTGAFAINMGLGTDNVFRIGGWSASVNAFQMTAAGALTMLGDVTAFSDIRLKDNIRPIPNALTKILNSRGVIFTRTDQEDRERVHIGVIAQEIEKYFPEVVIEDTSGIKSVNYGAMAGAFIEAIKELNDKICKLENLVEQISSNK